MLSEQILGILSKPKNVGQMRDADGVGKTKGTDGCHDFSKLFVKVESGKVTETKFQTYGGPVSIAAVSAVSEMIKGMKVSKLEEVTVEDVLNVLGEVDSEYLPCVQNAVDLLPAFVANYNHKLAKKEYGKDTKKSEPKAKEKKPADAKEPAAKKSVSGKDKVDLKKRDKSDSPAKAKSESVKAEKPVDEKKVESAPVETRATTVIADGERVEDEELDIFSEIDAITAKISEAVNKMKKK